MASVKPRSTAAISRLRRLSATTAKPISATCSGSVQDPVTTVMNAGAVTKVSRDEAPAQVGCRENDEHSQESQEENSGEPYVAQQVARDRTEKRAGQVGEAVGEMVSHHRARPVEPQALLRCIDVGKHRGVGVRPVQERVDSPGEELVDVDMATNRSERQCRESRTHHHEAHRDEPRPPVVGSTGRTGRRRRAPSRSATPQRTRLGPRPSRAGSDPPATVPRALPGVRSSTPRRLAWDREHGQTSHCARR